MRRIMLLSACLLSILPLRAADKLKAEDVVARHLASIGTPEARAAARTRVGEGKAEMRELVRGSSSLQGSSLIVCDGRRLKIVMKFPGSSSYPGEQWAFDGEKVMVAMTAPGARSSIGEFLYRYPEIMREGLLGGSLLETWPLLDLQGRQPKLSYDGLKKIDGRELHQLSYKPRKGGSDMEIRLFFEPETFRHVKTMYKLEVGSGIGADVGRHVDEVRYFLEENFSDFQTVDGLTLPTQWGIRYEIQPARGAVLGWNMKIEKVQHNAEL